MLRKTEDIVDKVEGCQDLVQLSPPLPSVSAANASSTGLTLPVALVATGVVVGAGATTAMTAPVATSATPRPRLSRPARHHVLRTRRVWRAYVHDHPHRARRPSRARCPRPRRAPASAAPTTAAPQADPADCRRRGVQALHGDPRSPRQHAGVSQARTGSRACLCVQPACAHPRGCRSRFCRALLPDAAGAGRAAGRQLAAAGLSPGCLGPVRSWAWALGREVLSAQVHPCGTARSAQPRSMRARARTVCRQNLKNLFQKKKLRSRVAAQISPSMMT